jgi:ABC-type polysaccharide/polyol phosphate export permease
MSSEALWRHRTRQGTRIGDDQSWLRYLRSELLGQGHALAVFTHGCFRATYRAQALGRLWPIANPVILMIVMSLVFGVVFPTPVGAYPVFLMLGLVPWHFLSHAWTDGTTCFLSHAEILKRTSVPGWVVATGTVLSHVMNLAFASLSILPLIFVYPEAFRLSPALILLPVVVALLVVLVLGLALASATLNVAYRDVGYIVNSALTVLFWASPIVYPLDHLPPVARSWMLLNPMAGLLTCLRDIVMGGRLPPLDVFAAASLSSVTVLALALLLYRRFSRELADHV